METYLEKAVSKKNRGLLAAAWTGMKLVLGGFIQMNFEMEMSRRFEGRLVRPP